MCTPLSVFCTSVSGGGSDLASSTHNKQHNPRALRLFMSQHSSLLCLCSPGLLLWAVQFLAAALERLWHTGWQLSCADQSVILYGAQLAISGSIMCGARLSHARFETTGSVHLHALIFGPLFFWCI